METAIATLVLVLLVGLMVVLVRRMKTTHRVSAAEDVVIGGRAQDRETALVQALSSVAGTNYVNIAPGLHGVEIRRIPVWAIIPVFLLFPVGLVFLFVRESIRLDVALFDGPDGAVVRLFGPTEQLILERVRTALTSLVPATPAR